MNNLKVTKRVFPNTTLHPIHDRRKLALYTVTENELEIISDKNLLSEISFSVGAFFLSIVVTYAVASEFSVVFYGALGFSVLSFINGFIALKQRRGLTEQIKKSHYTEEVL